MDRDAWLKRFVEALEAEASRSLGRDDMLLNDLRVEGDDLVIVLRHVARPQQRFEFRASVFPAHQALTGDPVANASDADIWLGEEIQPGYLLDPSVMPGELARKTPASQITAL